MQQRDRRRFRGLRQIFRAVRIDGEGFLGLRFRLVHRRIGRGVDHQIGAVIPHRRRHRGRVGNIKRLTIQRDNVQPMGGGAGLKRRADLPACARYKYFHFLPDPSPRRCCE